MKKFFSLAIVLSPFFPIYSCQHYHLKIAGKFYDFNTNNCIGSGVQGSVFQSPFHKDKVVKIFHGKDTELNSYSNEGCEREYQENLILRQAKIPILTSEKAFSEEGICYLTKDKLQTTLESICENSRTRSLIFKETFFNLIEAIERYNTNPLKDQEGKPLYLRDWSRGNIMFNTQKKAWVLVDFVLTNAYALPDTKNHYNYYFFGGCEKKIPDIEVFFKTHKWKN